MYEARYMKSSIQAETNDYLHIWLMHDLLLHLALLSPRCSAQAPGRCSFYLLGHDPVRWASLSVQGSAFLLAWFVLQGRPDHRLAFRPWLSILRRIFYIPCKFCRALPLHFGIGPDAPLVPLCILRGAFCILLHLLDLIAIASLFKPRTFAPYRLSKSQSHVFSTNLQPYHPKCQYIHWSSHINRWFLHL